MLNLSIRLKKIADFIRQDGSVCDVGTDHGYLPAFLSLSGKARSVTATDIREKPLDTARKNLEKYGVSDVRLVLCDGLDGVKRSEADTVVIAGMGGDVISGIIERCAFSHDPSVDWILQPMTSANELRQYLADNGYEVEKETAFSECKRIYSVMLVKYTGIPYSTDDGFIYAGKLDTCEEFSREYIEKQIRILKKCISDISAVKGKEEDVDRYSKTVLALKSKLDSCQFVQEDVNGV